MYHKNNNLNLKYVILNLKTNERWGLCFLGIFWRRGFQFHYKGSTILGCKSMSLGDLSSNCQY
jgi:hypothetical protein